MEGIFIVIALVALWVLVAPIVALMRAGDALRDARDAKAENAELRKRLDALERGRLKISPTDKTTDTGPEAVAVRKWLDEQPSKPVPDAPTVAAPPPLPWPLETEEPTPSAKRKPLVDYGDFPPPPPAPPAPPKEPFSWERFMGVKLFAWLGGIAMFFGVVFFVKYAFDNNLISPAMRVALGFLAGAGLWLAGLAIQRVERYRVLAQAFCATGVLILYGVSFAAHAVYHFEWFGNARTFALMAGITFAAFLTAVRLNALVVAVLGMLGGFLTPILLSTGEDQALALFGYIALLDVGLIAVSRHGRWRFLTPCAAAGTALMFAGWSVKFFRIGHYDVGANTLVPLGILSGFLALFLAGGWILRRRPDRHSAGAVLGLAGVCLIFAFAMLGFRGVATREFLLYGFVLLANLAVIAVTLTRPNWNFAQFFTAAITFLLLAMWTESYLTPANLTTALLLYLVFGALHTVVPVVARRWDPSIVLQPVSQWFAPVVLALIAMPLLQLAHVPMTVWAAVLAADLLVLALAISTRAILPVLTALVMTLILMAMWLTKTPVDSEPLLPFLLLVTGFSALFSLAGSFLFRDSPRSNLIPAASGILPFAMLALALEKLPVPNPTPVFVVALLMSALLAALAIFRKQGALILAALIGTLAVEAVWHEAHFQAAAPFVPLLWYLGFYAAFLALPFTVRGKLANQPAAWIAAALSGVGHFLLVRHLVKYAFPNDVMGMVPAAFAVPALAAVFALRKMFPQMDADQRSRLAWFGGVALLFITLIFPIQFERQWITLSWAIEGALLLWLFLRVPHLGLQRTGLALLAISFSRLALNPFVIFAYERGSTPILNWLLYVYGIAAIAHFVGAHWCREPRARGLLQIGGGLLLFLLLNLEIADYFTTSGQSSIDISFSGNFARDMTYSISWGLFSLGLLGIGFARHSKGARYAATGLLIATLLKVFLHDLSQIQSIFRIGALIGVAIIAFVASFLYQRFFDRSTEESAEP